MIKVHNIIKKIESEIDQFMMSSRELIVEGKLVYTRPIDVLSNYVKNGRDTLIIILVTSGAIVEEFSKVGECYICKRSITYDQLFVEAFNILRKYGVNIIFKILCEECATKLGKTVTLNIDVEISRVLYGDFIDILVSYVYALVYKHLCEEFNDIASCILYNNIIYDIETLIYRKKVEYTYGISKFIVSS